MRFVSFRVLGLTAALLLGTSSIALATPSGTQIVNTIDLSYETGGNTITVDDAASVEFVVDTGIDLVVEGQDASNTVVANQGQTAAVLTYRVENLSNDTFGFDINVSNTGTLGLTYNAAGPGAPGTYFVAYGTSPTYNAGTATVYNTAGSVNVMDRDTNEEFYIYIVANIPGNAVDGTEDAFTVTATTLNAGTNVAATELTGQGPLAVDVVFADPGENGFESDVEDLVIEAPAITGTKTQAVISENRQGTFDCETDAAEVGAEAHIPGACVEYTITVTNAAGASLPATDISITDVLPANVTFVTLDEGGFDTVTESAGTVTGTLATLAPGASTSFTVRVSIDMP